MQNAAVAQESAFAPNEAASWTVPRTPWGDPDFQGVWRYEATIPLERPNRLEGRAMLTPEEMAADRRLSERRNVEYAR